MGKTPKKYWILCIYLSLTLVTLAVFWQVHQHDFIDFDDGLYITDNGNIQNGLNWQGIKWAFTSSHAYNWHPLTWISHMIDCRLFGLNPAGHHLTSVIFHIANTLLLFIVLKSMTGLLWPGAFVAALFALHPLHVESVAWVAERKDVLSTFFWMLTMWFYLRYTRHPRILSYLPVMFSFALGLMAKQMLVTLPFVLILLDYWPLERLTLSGQNKSDVERPFQPISLSRCLIEKLPLLALSAAASLVVFLIQLKVTLVKTTIEIPIAYRLGNALVAYAKYIAKMFWPANLAILYPHPETSLPFWQPVAAALFLVAVSIVVVIFFRNRRWLIVGWLWFLGTLVPVIGLVQVGLQAMADRYTYIPLIGLFIIVSWGAFDIAGRLKYHKAVLPAAVLVVLSALTTLTWLQLSYWQNSIRLYERTVAATKNNDIMHYNLGELYYRQGDIDQAIEHWTRALKIKPELTPIRENLAALLSRQGKILQATEHYRQILKYWPEDKSARDNLNKLLTRHKKPLFEQIFKKANLLAQQGNFGEAIDYYNQALQINPNSAQIHNNLANTLFLQSKLDQAAHHYSKAIQLDPYHIDAHYNMAVLFAKQNRTDEAIKALHRTLQIDPNHINARRAIQALLKSNR